MSKSPRVILAIALATIYKNSGTPIRIRSIMHELGKDPDTTLITATFDPTCDLGTSHLRLTPGAHWQNYRVLRDCIATQKVTHVICHTIASYVREVLAVTLFAPNVKTILEMHGYSEEEQLMEGHIGRVKYTLRKWLSGFLYTRFDLIATCSDTSTDYLKRYQPNVITLYGGVDEAFMIPPEPITEQLRPIVIGYTGNTRPWQGLDFLLSTFAMFSPTHPNYRLRILTSAPPSIPLPEHLPIEWLPPTSHDQIPTFIASCDALIIPRLDNAVNRLSFPSKMKEYLAMGKAVIASRTSDTDKLIEHNRNGLLFTPGDVHGLTECLQTIQDAEVRERLGRAAYDTMRTGFTWQAQVKQLIDQL